MADRDYLGEALRHMAVAVRPDAPQGVVKARLAAAAVFGLLDVAQSLRALVSLAEETAIARGVREP